MHQHEREHEREHERRHRHERPRHPGHHEPGDDFGPWMRHLRSSFAPSRGPRRARRGDVRTAILTLVDEKPAHGYDLIRELEERSGGMWQPSPGSVYPTLQLLEDQGLLTSEDVDGKRVYVITDQGRADLATRKERDGGTAPWEGRGDGEGFGKLFGAMSQLGAAVMQVARAGGSDQMDRVAEIVTDARKKVYAILAED